MYKEKIGIVTESEKDLLTQVYERKSALQELMLVLDNPMVVSDTERNGIYQRIVDDLGTTNTGFDNIWSRLAIKYKWKTAKNGQWQIDFKTNEIFLIIND